MRDGGQINDCLAVAQSARIRRVEYPCPRGNVFSTDHNFSCTDVKQQREIGLISSYGQSGPIERTNSRNSCHSSQKKWTVT